MALYQDDMGNLYWIDAAGPVITTYTEDRAHRWGAPFLIHGHRLDSFTWSGRLIGSLSLLLAAVAVVLMIRGGHDMAGGLPAMSVMVALIGQMVILRRTGIQMVPSTVLRLLRPQPWGSLLLELAGKLSLITLYLSVTLDMLGDDMDSLWRQAVALVLGGGILFMLAQMGLLLLSLMRMHVRPS
ncbi:hypothetical protein [Niveispirillum sp.]|uniref:hypothetical protein n=1 Tax=Niveispirillum sp. TaxID=1917217 RepID=UPI001B699314|nr:hypothetical protein [Niveispirillum sp.]MBP7335053.1 hypothetical protein [Niveispirillum sp.]